MFVEVSHETAAPPAPEQGPAEEARPRPWEPLATGGPPERLAAAYGVYPPEHWVPGGTLDCGRPGLVIRQGHVGPRQARIMQMRGFEDGRPANGAVLLSRFYSKRRCVVPLDGYVLPVGDAWVYVTMKYGAIMSCAALWGSARDAGGVLREGFFLLTTSTLLASANVTIPILLHPCELDGWLTGRRKLVQELYSISLPYPADLLRIERLPHNGERP